MTIDKVKELIEAKKDQFLGKKIGDTGHLITNYRVYEDEAGKVKAELIATDPRSGVNPVTEDLLKWCEEHGIFII